MLEKRLGKIDFAEFGTMRDYSFQLGLQLGFSMSGSGVMDAGKYTVNMSPDCHWEMETRNSNLAESLDHVTRILKDAKVNYGLERTVTIYTADGEIIAQYTGKIDIEGNDGGYVLFDYEGKRYTYYNCFVESIAEIRP